ncbi:MAG: leucyl aminopeptidase [Elusimicrobia bacterium CG_4_9_14_3_um_filter_62_55]|nr:MAG: leucyl aminopeptidase [Elusimicrobia bacterium CG22_combo_CG10-13_8_21_14_all_63_91]PJA13382.1 MAG: leucyl aminopeptidase [Elusimicrobia bacterium CG_4_10_14_0_2_um_filter_63_34]PJB25617.1 MAG: leucyl aminopeptidase [Elusimicrobia bacterium CG_4_9_14_3_um_filter_62_55]
MDVTDPTVGVDMKISKNRLASVVVAVAGLALAAHASGTALPKYEEGVDIRPYLQAAKDAAGAPKGRVLGSESSTEKILWVTIGAEDLPEIAKAASLPLAAPVAVSDRAGLFRVPESKLPDIGKFMHEKFNRCGGFFAHETREQAETDLAAPASAGSGDYSIDRKEIVEPMVKLVDEREMETTISNLSGFNNRYYTSGTGVAAASWIKDRWNVAAAGRRDISVELHAHPGWSQPSVIATVKGNRNGGEVVVLGGHLDSIAGWYGGANARAPGADDNASGIAVLTEALRVLAASGYKPDRTIQFIGYAAEEVGLRGSKEIAEEYKNGGVGVVGVAQFDMTNFAGSGSQIFLVDDYTNPAQNAFMGRLIDAYVGVGWSTTRCGYACSDHASWTRAGFPASIPFESSKEGMNSNIHTARDTLANSGGNAKHASHFAKLAVAYMVELGKGGLEKTARRPD